ncbi:hypothetical protein [Nitratiruptor sp. YY09-18]|uniref:hypothetical protein n=1 Tax=Nitratiruptor sp. YY09-18 TaxID=2724901 RepID=UPI0019161E05|nr:hypothetical protein [Nitratiruptor sp. YY09-18]BCD67206.1 hypothetical protein NitYY0918_C0076 [Nitratiruptor sp. YY09-18]
MKYLILFITLLLQGATIQLSDQTHYKPQKLQSYSLPTTTPLYATARVWDKDLSFAKKFAIVELGGIEDIQRIDLFGFNKVVAYEWSAGFYKDENNYFIDWVKKHPQTLLNEKPNKEGVYFYDMCNEELAHKRISYLLEQKKRLHIAGYFFDWANEEFLYEKELAALKESFHSKHPYTSYAKCLEKFFKILKDAGALVISNQAYRNEELLEAVHYDMCESYMTQVKKSTAMANIEGAITFIPTTNFVPLDEVFAYFKKFAALKAKYPFQEMIYMNYAAPILEPHGDILKTKKPRDIIYYNYVLAKLGGFYSYTEVPFDHTLEYDHIYCVDLGNPQGAIQHKDGVYWRFFYNGFVIVAPHITRALYLRIKTPGLIDIKDGQYLSEQDGWTTFVLEPIYYNFENRYLPQAKVFLYADKVLHK